jgi:hypothetical protein
MQSKVSFRLTVRQGPMPGKVIELVKDIIVLGRDVNNDIVVNDAEVSRTHARLTAQGEGYIVEDLASTNGTFLNGQRLTGPKLMRHGDMLGLGETVVMEFGAVKDTRDPDSTVVASGSAPFNIPANPPPAEPLAGSPAPRASTAPLSEPAPPPAAAPSAEAPVSAPARDNRPLIIGGICGCLALCACLAIVAAAVYYAYYGGVLPFGG